MQFIHIQILRFFAATAVVLFHSIGTGKNYFPGQDTLLFGAFKHGGLGVDLFFVISGFIIYHSTHRSNPSPSMFLRRRIERIAPLYWFATISIVLLALIFPQGFKGIDWISTDSVLKSLFFHPFYGWSDARRLRRLVSRIRNVFLSVRRAPDGPSKECLERTTTDIFTKYPYYLINCCTFVRIDIN